MMKNYEKTLIREGPTEIVYYRNPNSEDSRLKNGDKIGDRQTDRVEEFNRA
jgi:hypothetical protein